MNNKIKEMTLFNKTLFGVIVLTLVLSVVLFFVTRNENGEVESLIIGSITSLFLNYYHVKSVIKISNNNISKLKSFVIISYIARYLIYGILVLLGWLVTPFNPVYIMFGIVLYPTVTLVMSLTLVKGE